MLEAFNRIRPAFAIAVPLTVYPPELLAEPMRRLPQLVFYDPEFRDPMQSIEDYAAAEHIVLDLGGEFESVIEKALRTCDLRRRVALGVPNIAVLAKILRGSDMVCTLQAALKEGALRNFATSEAPFPLPDVQFDMIWHRRDRTDAASQWLRELIKSCLPGGEPSVS